VLDETSEQNSWTKEDGGTGVGDFEMGSVGEFGEESEEGDFVVCDVARGAGAGTRKEGKGGRERKREGEGR